MGISMFPFTMKPSTSVAASTTNHTIKKDLISSPIPSTTTEIGINEIPTSLIPAIDYISRKLRDKHFHISLVIGQSWPCPGKPAVEVLIPALPIPAEAQQTLEKILVKATKKYRFGHQWTEALARHDRAPPANSDLVRRSILQNQVLYSGEGLTLLSIDYLYTLKSFLHAHSHTILTVPWASSITSSIELLRRITSLYGGRPLSKGYFDRAYDHYCIRDEVVEFIARAYRARYGADGIAFEATDDRTPRPEQQKFPRYRRGPVTPNSASQITPITRNEWNVLVGLQC